MFIHDLVAELTEVGRALHRLGEEVGRVDGMLTRW